MLIGYLARAATTTFGSLTRPDAELTEEVDLPFVAWPWDIDWNGHVNNGRYLTLMDHGRLDHGLRTGLIQALIKARTNAVVAKASIQFVREVRPFVRCTLVTRIRGWDDRRTYYEQRFEHQGRVCVKAEVAIALRHRNKSISPLELMSMAKLDVPLAFARLRVPHLKVS